MTRAGKWLGGLALVMLAVAAGWLAMVRLIPSDEELAQRLSAELETRLGVPFRIGALHWRLFPSPAVVLEDVASGQARPIIVRKLTAHPDLLALWQRRLKIDSAELEGAEVPQQSLRGLGSKRQADEDDAGEVPLARFVFRDLTWISLRGIAVVYEGEADFDPAWRPRKAQLRRPGFQPATDLTLKRQGQEERWDVQLRWGGGTAKGQAWLEPRAGGGLHLAGQLQVEDVEVSSALAAIGRRSVVAGKASGKTTLNAKGETVGELARTLHTKTLFTMSRASLLRFDLEKTIRSAGKQHEGQTPLDAVTGQLDTQNTAQGMELSYTDIKASSGSLTATGQAKVANQRINGEFAVDLVDGIVGVPLTVGGPLEDVQFSVPTGAVAGAVLGTAVLPGVGTAIGARVGATVGKIFGPKKSGAPSSDRPDAPDKAR